MSQKKALFFLFLIFALLFTSCGTTPKPTAVPSQAPTKSSGGNGAYPAPGSYPGPGAYPGPGGAPAGSNGQAPNSGPLPTSSSGGTVTGSLLIGKDLKPVNNYPIYLGQVLNLSSGEPGLVSIDRAKSPRAFLDGTGKFVFINVPPGKYSLILDIVEKTFILREPATGNDILIDVEEGKTIDLGILKYPDLVLGSQP